MTTPQEKHVLIISGDPGFRFTSALTLNWHGYQTSEAKDSKEAIRLIKLNEERFRPVNLLLVGMENLNLFFSLIVCLKKNRISLPILSTSKIINPSVYPFFYIEKPGFFCSPMKTGELLSCVTYFLRRKEVRNYGAKF